MLLILIVFQCEISGNLIKDVHPLNKLHISLVYSMFHLEISGKYFKDEHPANRPCKL